MKIEITEKQRQQFNQMLEALNRIKSYPTDEKLKKICDERNSDYEEELEEAYTNILNDAFSACENVKPIE